MDTNTSNRRSDRNAKSFSKKRLKYMFSLWLEGRHNDVSDVLGTSQAVKAVFCDLRCVLAIKTHQPNCDETDGDRRTAIDAAPSVCVLCCSAATVAAVVTGAVPASALVGICISASSPS